VASATASKRRAERALGEVVILDEHPIWVNALETILSGGGIRVAGTTTSPKRALELVCEKQPDVLIAPLVLANSEMEALELLGRARERHPGLRLVVIASYDNGFHLSAAASAQADAYLPRTVSAPEFVDTVRACLVGERRPATNGEVATPSLTQRELEIVTLAARGYTNSQIAERLWITRWTVKYHLANAYKKLGVANRTQAARQLFERRLSGHAPCSG
jgi:two-component system, NarL family, response regulator LiaR